jgi:subtilase family serine protease
VVSGTCKGYAKPTWQSVSGNPADGVRDLPDVSLFAANGVWGHYYVFCWSDTANGGTACSGAPSGWAGAGGTSFASPIWAGIQALVNQKKGAKQGNPNPRLYALAYAQYSGTNAGVFHDVTLGDMDVNCSGTHNCYKPSGTYGVLSTSNSSYSKAYGTGTGWDFATGIGTVNVLNLLNAW